MSSSASARVVGGTGTFFSVCDPDDGQFAALVETDGTALFLDYDPLDFEGGLPFVQ